MAEEILNAPFLSVDAGGGAVDLSSHIEECKLEYSQETKDLILASTNPANMPLRRRLVALSDLKISGSLSQDHASGSVNDTLLLCQGKNDLIVVFRRKNDTVSATNPSFTITACRSSPLTIGGKVAEIPMVPFEFSLASGALAIATT